MKLALIALLAACADEANVEPLPDYRNEFSKVIATGSIPGHGDTYRVIYYNMISTGRQGLYDQGTIFVKEVFDHEGGSLEEIAVMRQVADADHHDAFEGQGGWLFTIADSPTGPEHENDRCWRTCHVAAPYRGVWLNYGH